MWSLPTTQTPPKPPRLFSTQSCRLRICLLMMMALMIAMCMRVNLSMGLPCMINSTLMHIKYNASLPKGGDEGTGTLDWSPSKRSWIFTASSYGSMVSTILGGYVSDRFQPKIVITLGVLGMAATTAVGPLLAGMSYWGFFVSRTLQGFSGGFIFPAASAMASRWFPPMERSTLGSLYSTGSSLGSSVVPMIVAFLCTSPLGWPSIFYLFSGIAFIYLTIWISMASNLPTDNHFISEREKDYLAREIDFDGTRHGKKLKEGADNFPWVKLLFSPPLLANYSCQFSYQFAQTMMQNFLPMYFSEQLGFSIKKNGLYTTLPNVLTVLMGFFWGVAADFMKKRQILTPTRAAKVCQSIDCFGSAAALMLFYLIPTRDTPGLALVFLFLYGITFPAGVSGYFTSLLSICPRYSGTIMSINRIFGLITHLGTPMLMTLFNRLELKDKWLYMYSLAALFQVIAGILFILFGDSKVQEWARRQEKQEPPKPVQVDPEVQIDEVGKNGKTE